jgi:5-methylcytosine-specific restriction enzyme A
MSLVRWKSLPTIRKDSHGYYLCRLCQRACPDSRTRWCSEACLRRYLIESQGSFVREQLFKRDRGICAECGVDAARMDFALSDLKEDLLHPLLMSIHPMIVETLRAEGWRNVKLRGKGSYADAIEFTSCWEAHHHQAVAEGGGECGLENYRTLCFICHKNLSAKQARERAEQRRLAKLRARQIAKTPLVYEDDGVIPF